MNDLRDQLMTSLNMPRMTFQGMIIHRIRTALKAQGESCGKSDCGCNGEITIEGHQLNGMDGVHQARVRLSNDPTIYRLILAPADAPLELYGRPIGHAFSKPLGDQ